MSSELVRIPSVVLSERTFEKAQQEGILDIVPNHDHMLAIGQLTETGQDYLPDVTVLRDHGRIGDFDINFKDAAGDLPYFPSSELSVTERARQFIFAGSLRRHTAETGKKLIELTVSDWDALGQALTEAIEGKKTLEKGNPGQTPNLAINALGWAVSSLLRRPELDSPQRKRIKAGNSLQPYSIKRRS